MKSIPVTMRFVLAAGLLLAIGCIADRSHAGCPDADFLRSVEIYEQAIKETSAARKIELLERAFKTCPGHGRHAAGYYLLGKLYLDQGDKEKAFEWLVEANRFKTALIQRSVEDLAQSNLMLGQIYRDKGDAEKALVHMNIYKALTKVRNKKVDQAFLDGADAFLAVMYTPGTVKETLQVQKDVEIAYRALINRLEVYFDFDKALLDEDARKRLDGIGEALKSEEFRGASLVVEGHTDEEGTEEYNCGLGLRRAAAVVDYFRQRWGITHVQFVPASFGKSSPSISRTGHGRSQWPKIDRFNRRVVVWNGGAQERLEKDVRVEALPLRSPCQKESRAR
jgi:outer membrane protein OmpA-like peptidoglycan-associated protein